MPDIDELGTVDGFVDLLRQERLVAVLRSVHTTHYESVVEQLITQGIRVIELTLTATDPYATLARVNERFGSAAIVGMGTLLTRQDAIDAINAGARFLVTPLLVPDVIAVARQRGVPVIAGALSPTEIYQAVSQGANAVKVFPASAVGPRYLREIAGPLPGLALMPSGGVDVDDVGPWLAAGAAAVSLGGSLIGRALDGDTDGLDRRIDHAVRAAHGDSRP